MNLIALPFGLTGLEIGASLTQHSQRGGCPSPRLPVQFRVAVQFRIAVAISNPPFPTIIPIPLVPVDLGVQTAENFRALCTGEKVGQLGILYII